MLSFCWISVDFSVDFENVIENKLIAFLFEFVVDIWWI